ncbi:MAG: tRNA (adenosine(37)-N6)-threonylcarbamoyltransferase complex transferase subunit TsaD [Oscillospiraceae bacterium]|nr:tRNA (adenosine(37)-N6)-threonylcarbamoyltransferase complex transferase subunit TsaD [Oscillospiraceae bacterium]MDD4368105.1 tRNA (adenosine(37)-N6)-threonylcarbamoyltransferase complex transferase subunit TsaD [Oscillospiraceae bacterium]
MKILAIESSCDETACAVIEDGRTVLSNVISSQADLHHLFGGVVPEIASRKHIEAIVPVLRSGLAEAGLTWSDIDCLAVTCGPGLVGALLVGVSFAKGLASALQKPLVPVHHLAAHLAANYLHSPDLAPPFMALIVSGGHSHIVLVRDYCDFDILARTRDDAAGEAFDKISRALGLGYPGGPLIDALAATGDPQAVAFPKPNLADHSLDFSFSGLKTAALNELNRQQLQADPEAVRQGSYDPRLADFCSSYQHAVVSELAGHAVAACLAHQVRRLVLAGGVAANQGLRKLVTRLTVENRIELFIPPAQLCTDNAAMVGAMAYYCPQPAGLDRWDAKPSLDLETWSREQTQALVQRGRLASS